MRGIRVASKTELGERLGLYIEGCNASPVVPKWRYGIGREEPALAA